MGDEVGVARRDGGIERECVFFHGQEKGNLLCGTRFVCKELSCEVCAPFVVGSTGDGRKGDTTLGGESRDDGGADNVFGGGGAADLLGSPVHVDFVGREAEIFGYADGEEVFLAVNKALD